MRLARFKGGPVSLNSGGFGPDDYLLKPIKGGRWTLVIFRWGRNWTGDKQALNDDRAAQGCIFPIQQICVPDNARRYQQMKRRGNLPVMNAAEFWEKYQEYPMYEVPKEQTVRPQGRKGKKCLSLAYSENQNVVGRLWSEIPAQGLSLPHTTPRGSWGALYQCFSRSRLGPGSLK